MVLRVRSMRSALSWMATALAGLQCLVLAAAVFAHSDTPDDLRADLHRHDVEARSAAAFGAGLPHGCAACVLERDHGLPATAVGAPRADRTCLASSRAGADARPVLPAPAPSSRGPPTLA